MVEVLVLCGGFAKRLEPITEFIPKHLLYINGRPIIDYVFESVEKLSPKRIVLSTNQKFYRESEYWVRLKEAAGYNSKVEIVVEPTRSNEEKFGAVRGIAYAIEKAMIKDDLLIVAGDNLYDFDLTRLYSAFESARKPTIALYDVGSLEDAKRFGVVSLSGSRITGFEEKPPKPKSTLVSTGIYIYPKEMLGKFGEYINGKNNPDAPGYFLEWLTKSSDVLGVPYTGKWHDIGTLEMYRKLFNGM